MAQAFSSMLDTTFSLDSDVDQLSQNIDSKCVPDIGVNPSVSGWMPTNTGTQEARDDDAEPGVGNPPGQDSRGR